MGFECDGEFRNPIPNVKVPAANREALLRITIDEIIMMAGACNTVLSFREKAIPCYLVDFGHQIVYYFSKIHDKII